MAEWGEQPRKSVYDPKYPVIKQFPSMGEIMGNMNMSDYSRAAAITGAGYLYGYIISHRPYTLRHPTAIFSAIAFSAAGLTASYLASRQRLVGDAPNKAEYEAMLKAQAPVEETQEATM